MKQFFSAVTVLLAAVSASAVNSCAAKPETNRSLITVRFGETPHAGSDAPAPVVTTTPSTAAQPQDVAVVAMPSETPGSGESLTNEDATYEQRESAIAAVDRPNGVRTSGEFTPPAAPPNPQPARTGGRPVYHRRAILPRRRWR